VAGAIDTGLKCVQWGLMESMREELAEIQRNIAQRV